MLCSLHFVLHRVQLYDERFRMTQNFKNDIPQNLISAIIHFMLAQQNSLACCNRIVHPIDYERVIRYGTTLNSQCSELITLSILSRVRCLNLAYLSRTTLHFLPYYDYYYYCSIRFFLKKKRTV